ALYVQAPTASTSGVRPHPDAGKSPSRRHREMPMRSAVSEPDDDLRSTERSLLGTLAGVLSAVPDYLFAWLLEPDEEAVPLFESRRLAVLLGRQVPLGPLDLLRAAV